MGNDASCKAVDMKKTEETIRLAQDGTIQEYPSALAKSFRNSHTI
jgi:hypothetical protein